MSSPDPVGNPYQPPRAPVVDVEETSFAERPPLINVAVALILLSTLVGYLNTAHLLISGGVTGLWGRLILGMLFSAGLVGWIAYKIWRGRNWARIVMLILVVIGLTVASTQLPTMYQMSKVVAAVFAIRSTMFIAAMLILFVSSARSWFTKASGDE